MPIINMIPAKSTMVVAAGTTSILVRQGIVLHKESWVKESEDSLYYQYRLDDDTITEKSVVDIRIGLDYLTIARDADIKPTTDSYAGYVILFASNIPETDIVCDYIIQQEAEHTKVQMDGSDINLHNMPFSSEIEGLADVHNLYDAIIKLKQLIDGKGTYVISDVTPEETNLLWIDTGNGGVLKYYDDAAEQWKPTKAVWG